MENTLEKTPPESGEIVFSIDRSPASFQTKGQSKQQYKDHIVEIVKKAGFLLSGDIQIYITWSVHEEKRYESDASADIDNIIKPLLDALCGPTGIMIDDNQVQLVQCSWIDSYIRGKEKIDIRIIYIPDEFVPKDGLAFVNIKNNLCLPFCKHHSPKALSIFISGYEQQFTCRDELTKHGLDYYQSRGEMSIQRVFHKTRLQKFEVMDLDKVRDELIIS